MPVRRRPRRRAWLLLLAALLVAGEADPPPPVVDGGAADDGVVRVVPAVQLVAEGAGTVTHDVRNGTGAAVELTVAAGRVEAGPAGGPTVVDSVETGTLHLASGETARLTSRLQGPVTALVVTGTDGTTARALAVAAPTATAAEATAAVETTTGGLRLRAAVTARGGRPAVVDVALRLRQWPDQVLFERQLGAVVVWPERARRLEVAVEAPAIPLVPVTLDVAAAVRGADTTARDAATVVPTGTRLLAVLAALAVLASAVALAVVWRRRR